MPAPPVTALYNGEYSVSMIIALNTYKFACEVMGKKGQAHLLSFVESCSGPCNEPVWTVQCKIAGEVKGVGVARQKAAAKSAAAQQALDVGSALLQNVIVLSSRVDQGYPNIDKDFAGTFPISPF
ncbi:hypothetical protein C0993_009045 [Termitomyces sp. T159_Od127]|nr:hypothetical protein C0993_009045 [Termitomyces sp. T159_Od127]